MLARLAKKLQWTTMNKELMNKEFNMHPNDPRLQSFIAVDADSDFPIQNLPYGIFSTAGDAKLRVGVAIGDQILDLAVLEQAGLLQVAGDGRRVFDRASLNPFIALGRDAWSSARSQVSALLRKDNPALRDDESLRARAFSPMLAATLALPVEIGGYTDFYSSKEHATNVGAMFRDPKNALLPNWLEMPIGYNGRASSVIVSGTPVRRPNGQLKAPDQQRPVLAACRKLDIELELGFIVGVPNRLGEAIPCEQAEQHIFGMVLLNDWSARDVQQWEYVPLGPFNAKTFATTISPWVVTLEALEPFRTAQPLQEPVPLPYLRHQGAHNFDIALQVALTPQESKQATTIASTNFKHMYWTMAQQLAHHTVSGCNTRVGDLMGSGTVSSAGPLPAERGNDAGTVGTFGSLLELTWNGQYPLLLADGQQRSFIEDGDSLTLTGWCQGNGYRIGFGECSGVILPAPVPTLIPQ
jgi:fumarylacetoacetase